MSKRMILTLLKSGLQRAHLDDQIHGGTAAVESWLDTVADLVDSMDTGAAPAIRVTRLAEPAPTAAPVATIHVDGSFCHVEWHVPVPNEADILVYTNPSTLLTRHVKTSPKA